MNFCFKKYLWSRALERELVVLTIFLEFPSCHTLQSLHIFRTETIPVKDEMLWLVENAFFIHAIIYKTCNYLYVVSKVGVESCWFFENYVGFVFFLF